MADGLKDLPPKQFKGKMEEQSIFSAEEYQQNFKRNKKGKKEEKIQLQVCEYLANTYPDLIWFCDLASGMKLPIWIAALHKKMRSSRGLPDLFIAKGKYINHGYNVLYGDDDIEEYNGLFIEIKKDSVRLKSGGISSSEHHTEQEAILSRLRLLGFKAEFGVGYDECKKLIDEYLK